MKLKNDINKFRESTKPKKQDQRENRGLTFKNIKKTSWGKIKTS